MQVDRVTNAAESIISSATQHLALGPQEHHRGLAVYMLETRKEVKNVGFLLVIGVVILDAMVSASVDGSIWCDRDI